MKDNYDKAKEISIHALIRVRHIGGITLPLPRFISIHALIRVRQRILFKKGKITPFSHKEFTFFLSTSGNY